MKTLLLSFLLRTARITACNDTAAPARPLRVCSAVNEQLGALGDNDWVRVTPYGDFPVTVQIDGQPRRVMQKMDRAAADSMVGAFNSLITTVATLGRGLPIFEGHVDDPDWLARHPGARKAAVGRLKKLEAREDGLYALPAWNSIGTDLVRGDAPAYVAQSPHWNLELIGDRATARTARPSVLRSLALTNNPNIPGNVLGLNEDDELSSEQSTTATKTMNPEIIALLAALGVTLAADAAPEAIATAAKAAKAKLDELNSSATTLAKDKTDLEGKVTTAANEAATLKTKLATERAARTGVIVDLAVKSGKLPEAKRAEWVTALNEAPDFTVKAGELEKLVPAINTSSQVSALAARREETAKNKEGITAINEAVDEHMKTKGITDRDIAWREVKAAKPTLFA